MNPLYNKGFDIYKSFLSNDINFEEYTNQMVEWGVSFNDFIKSDASRGGKLVKKTIIDKNGKQVTKWVRSGSNDKNKIATDKEIDLEKYPKHVWVSNLKTASIESLQKASIYAKNLEIRKMAFQEVLKRTVEVDKYLNLSLLPAFMVDDYISRYDGVNAQLTQSELNSIHKYRDLKYSSINNKLRLNQELDNEDKKIVDDLENSINSSQLKNDVVLYRGLNSRHAFGFINYLQSLDVGDTYVDEGFSSTTILEGSAHKFQNLYNSLNNITIEIYASKGQNALCMQNLGTEDDKIMYKDEYEFLLNKNSRFQIIEKNKNKISVKLI